MYQSHWQLTEKPFENCADLRYYYPSEAHQGALLKLRYAIENQRGVVVLAGAAGLGKTLLVHTLQQNLPDDFRPFCHVVFPQMPSDELLWFLADEMGAPLYARGDRTIQHSVRRIQSFLHENLQNQKHTVLVIDESQLIEDAQTFETLRLLLNFELAGRAGLTLVLVGQPSLLTTLDHNPTLNQRVGVKCLLRPLNVEETSSYVQHRLNVAGNQQELFDTEALATIHQLTNGVPRRINQLCDLTLLISYAEQRDKITSEQIETVCEEMLTVAPE